MSISLANRVKKVETYYFAQKLAEIRQRLASGQDIINLGIGSPDLPPADGIIDRLTNSAAEAENHGYQSYRGSLEFRKAITQWYLKHFGVSLNPNNQILPLMGSKEGIMHISMTYLEEGDIVLVPDPGYPSYEAAAKLAGANIFRYPLLETNGYLPQLDSLSNIDGFERVKIMWINYPHMPTGAVATFDFYQKLLAFAEEHNILICSDNPYSFLHDDYNSMLAINGAESHVIELMSMSKNYHMAGWRVGFMSSSKEHIDHVLRFKSNMDSGMFLAVQQAATYALNMSDEWFTETKKIYQERREKVWEIAKYLGLSIDKEKKGLFVWAKISALDDKLYIEKLLDKAGVFIAPGSIFGDNGKGYVRFSLCQPLTIISKAFSKIKTANL